MLSIVKGKAQDCAKVSDQQGSLFAGMPRSRRPIRAARHGKHHHLGKALAEAVRRALLVVEVDDLSTEPRKLIQQGPLDVVALVDAKRLHGYAYRSHGSLSGTASMRLSANGSRSSPA